MPAKRRKTRRSGWRLTAQMKCGLEQFSAEDGVQRGAFFDTSGNFRLERVSATAMHSWLFKTKAGQPFKWNNSTI